MRGDALLKPIGEDGSAPAHESIKKLDDGRIQQPAFNNEPVLYVHKFTDNKEYNALRDPLLKKHFRRKSVQQTLISQALSTPDNFVLHTSKTAHVRSQMAALRGESERAQTKLDQQRANARELHKATFKELCDQKLKVWRDQQQAQADMVAKIKGKVDANRVSVAEAPLTEQGRIYVEERKITFEQQADEEQMRQMLLDAERQIKNAKVEKRLKEETEAKRAALKEAIEIQEAQLAAVKLNIKETKAAQTANMEKVKRDLQDKQDKTREESEEFKMYLVKVFTERAEEQQKEIETRKQKAAEDRARREARMLAEREEKALKLQRQREVEQRAREEGLRLLEAEERERKIMQMMEKEERKKAKAAYVLAQAERARRFKEQGEQERAAAKVREIELEEEEKAKREAQAAKNRLEKQKAEEAKAKLEKERKERVAFEAEMARKQMAQQIADAEAAFMAEQKKLWEATMAEELRQEHERAEKKKIDAKRQRAAAAALKLQEEQEEMLRKKAEKEKARKKREIELKLKRAREETERRVAYMKKFGV